MEYNRSKFVLLLLLIFILPNVAFAVRGEGTATVDGAANVNVPQAISHVFTVVLTVGASGISADAENPTFTIPVGFTAPDATPVANAGLVLADGDWSVIGGDTCLVDSPSVGLTASSGQVITVDVTAACTVGPGGNITLTYKGTSNTVGATFVDVATNDVISAQPVKSISLPPNSATLPTITVTAVDTTAPTVTVTMDDAALNIGDTSLVTFTFSETPVGFTTADVSVANGSIGAIDTSNPLVQTATYTPTNGITDTTNIITVGTAWTDAALNAGVGDDSPNYTIDTIAPTVSVTMNDTALIFGETTLVTFTFSEAPIGFNIADVAGFPNGVISSFTSTIDPLVYTAIFTIDVSINDITNVITVGTSWTDAALNAGVGDDSPNYTIDTAAGNSRRNSNTITVFKQVINDNGGTARDTDFPLFINGNPVTSGQTVFLPPGIYTVTETNRPGYTRTFTGHCDANGQINHGDVGTHNDVCTIVNNDIGAPITPIVPPLIDVVKIPSPLSLPLGPGPVIYTYTLRNIGTVPVSDIRMLGDTCSPIILFSGDANGDLKLDVSETWIYHCVTTLSATYTSIVTAVGWANGISAVDAASATVVVGASIIPPLVHITKIPSPLSLSSGPGLVTYTMKVSNPGIIALSNVAVADDKCEPVKYISGDMNNDSMLDTTETWTYTCGTRVSQTTTNTATAIGSGNGLVATDFALATVVVAIPQLPDTGFPPKKQSSFWDYFTNFFSRNTDKKAGEAIKKPMSYHTNIVKDTKENENFRRVLFTGKNSQLVIMNVPPGGEIGAETHAYTEQTLFFLSGTGEGEFNGKKFPVGPGDVAVVVPGTEHNFRNTGMEDLKIYTVYAPPNHIDGRIHKTKADADSDAEDEAIGETPPIK